MYQITLLRYTFTWKEKLKETPIWSWIRNNKFLQTDKEARWTKKGSEHYSKYSRIPTSLWLLILPLTMEETEPSFIIWGCIKFPTYFLQTIPFPPVAPPVQSSMPYSITNESFWSTTPAGENTQELQSAETSDVVLYLSSPPTTGIATPGFAGFLKSGW